MSDGVIVAIVGGAALVFANTTTSLLSYLAAREARRQLTPSNGTRTAQMVEETHKKIDEVKQDLSYHVTVQHGRGPIPKESP